jgi:hypothetical protein
MTRTAGDVTGRAAEILKDEMGILWPQSSLLEHVNDGQREIVNVRPEAATRVVVAQLDAGDQQTLPADGVRLVDIPRNLRLPPQISVIAGGDPGGDPGGNIALPEGNSGTTNFTFTISRDLLGYGTGITTVDYVVTGSGGNPVNAADFVGNTLPSGTVTFAEGETSKTLTIAVQGDTDVEPDEGFTVTLSNPTNGGFIVGTATGTIQNDDASIPLAKFLIINSTYVGGTGFLSMKESMTSPFAENVTDQGMPIWCVGWGFNSIVGTKGRAFDMDYLRTNYPGQSFVMDLHAGFFGGAPDDRTVNATAELWEGGVLEVVGENFGYTATGGTLISTASTSMVAPAGTAPVLKTLTIDPATNSLTWM